MGTTWESRGSPKKKEDAMKKKNQSRGTGWHRFLVRFLTFGLIVLIYWLLGFLVEDIRSVEGPRYADIETQFVDQDLFTQVEGLKARIEGLDRDIRNEAEEQRVVSDGSRSLQQTMTQLLELQKLGLEKQISVSTADQENLSSTLDLFLENQRQYQALSRSSTDLIKNKQGLVTQLQDAEATIEQQRIPAREAHQSQWEDHRLRLAFWQLVILVPILLAAAFLLMKKRGSLHFPFYLAVGIASLIKVGLVVHEYFPSRYFKYILIGALLLVVAKMLGHFLRAAAQPKVDWLIKQYREAYERFLCPVCDYPIRTGPRRFLFWTRRSVSKLRVPVDEAAREEPYTCPACGTDLFSECQQCHNVRHTLLPHCQHCGTEGGLE